jgi:AcrR family transcriptional regulator
MNDLDLSRPDPAALARRPRRLAKTAQTRARILDAALALFNERGTAAVSTNHVAAAAGLSPGNLYYHYADKQEIIRALHERYAAAHEALWGTGGGQRPSVARLRDNLARSMELTWQYRFLEREIIALLRADERLAAAHRAAYERRLSQWVAFGEQLAGSGVIRRPPPPVTIADLATAAWLIGAGWLPFLEITGNPQDPAQVARAGDLVLAVLGPYLEGSGASGEEEP